MNAYFGEDWGAPATEGQLQVPTPVGEKCGYCGVPIEADDRGFIMNHLGRGADGEYKAFAVPWHRECQMRTVVGSPEHLDGKCTCHGGAPGASQSPQEMRGEAIAVWERLTGRPASAP